MLTQSCIILAIVAYLALMIIIGISFSKKNNSTDDFYLGGRKLGPIVTAMSAEASDILFLCHLHLIIKSLHCKQFIMGATFDNFALVDDENQVGILDGR